MLLVGNLFSSSVEDTINKYGYLFDRYEGELDLSPLFPKTNEEVKRENMTRLERMKAFPEEQRYSMFSKEGNTMVNDMMIKLIELLQSDNRVSKELFQETINVYVKDIEEAGHGEVTDTAVRDVVLSILEKEIKKADRNIKHIELC